jgi:hypothetical protein
MMRTALLVLACLLMPNSAAAEDQFPLTTAAWRRLQELRTDQQFYTSCFVVTGPAGDLAAAISEAQAAEGPRLVHSECAGETPITPEDIFQLGMMYCQRKRLGGDWLAMEAAFESCVGRARRVR